MTSAPQSAKTAPAAGTKVNCATSSTRTPFIGRITLSPLHFGFLLGRGSAAGRTDVDYVHHHFARPGDDVMQHVGDGGRHEEVGPTHPGEVAVGFPKRPG